MCSVRHSPMPSAPKSRARAASAPVSALARTPRRPAADLVGPAQDHVELRRAAPLDERHRAEHTAPVEPSMEITSPSSHDRVADL